MLYVSMSSETSNDFYIAVDAYRHKYANDGLWSHKTHQRKKKSREGGRRRDEMGGGQARKFLSKHTLHLTSASFNPFPTHINLSTPAWLQKEGGDRRER